MFTEASSLSKQQLKWVCLPAWWTSAVPLHLRCSVPPKKGASISSWCAYA